MEGVAPFELFVHQFIAKRTGRFLCRAVPFFLKRIFSEAHFYIIRNISKPAISLSFFHPFFPLFIRLLLGWLWWRIRLWKILFFRLLDLFHDIRRIWNLCHHQARVAWTKFMINVWLNLTWRFIYMQAWKAVLIWRNTQIFNLRRFKPHIFLLPFIALLYIVGFFGQTSSSFSLFKFSGSVDQLNDWIQMILYLGKNLIHRLRCGTTHVIRLFFTDIFLFRNISSPFFFVTKFWNILIQLKNIFI